MGCEWHDKIFTATGSGFEALALEIFQFQYVNNSLYKRYVDTLGIDPGGIRSCNAIPFLPISFFKTYEVRTGNFEPAVVFESSGTTHATSSRHLIKDVSIYTESFRKNFESDYGPIEDLCVLGLLPSYLEKGNSSLVYMVKWLIEKSGHPLSGFYLYEYEKLASTLEILEKEGQKTILFGVTYALLDFAEKFPIQLMHTSVIETGGMKGRKKEMTRMQVHDILKNSFSINAIHSEYGMTELLSQAYSKGEGRFHYPPWMRILIRDDEDPFEVRGFDSLNGNKANTIQKPAIVGGINIIDLANVYSCAFIATDDVGKLHPDNSFEVLGRMDGSDLRGCSLLAI